MDELLLTVMIYLILYISLPKRRVDVISYLSGNIWKFPKKKLFKYFFELFDSIKTQCIGFRGPLWMWQFVYTFLICL